MTRLAKLLATPLILTALAAPAAAGSVKSDIDAALAQYAAAFNRGDAGAVAALYTEDAALLPPGEVRVDGRAGIDVYWQSLINAGIGDIRITAVEVEAAGNFAYEVGAFSLSVPGEGGPITVHGKHIVVWKRGADGVWRLHRDIWNGDPGP